MTQKYLLVKGCAGLGNRIFQLSLLNYCIKNNRRLVIDWSDGILKKGEDVFKDFFHIDTFFMKDLSLKYNI